VYEVPFVLGRPEIISHFINSDRDNVIHIQDCYAPLQIPKGVFYTLVNSISSPQVPVFEVLKDIDLSGSFRSVLFPTAPIGIVTEIVLSGAGLKDLIPGFGPGKFIA